MNQLVFEASKVNNKTPKYSMPENERRWLVDSSFVDKLNGEPHYIIKDKYLSHSRMRLRMAIHSANRVEIYKLSKKYGSNHPISEPITSIYLTKKEFDTFSSLDGELIAKKRYEYFENKNRFLIDVFSGRHEGLVISEFSHDDLERVEKVNPPSFTKREISAVSELSGASLAKGKSLKAD